MQVTFFIGNGFDRALGLHTSYREFYEFCLEEVTSRERKENEFLDAFMKALEKDEPNEFSNWSDLEQKLGNFMPDPITNDSVKSYGKFHQYIGDKLIEHLKDENKRVDINGLKKSLLAENLKTFIDKHCKKDCDTEEVKIDFIVFNYTDIFANLINELKTDDASFSGKYNIGEVLNVHGTITGRSVIFGIGKTSKASVKGWNLLNKDGRTKIERWIVKEKMLSENQDLVELRNKAAALISQSNYIITFGAAVGETDSVWWKQVGDALKSNRLNCKFLVCKYEDRPTQAGQESVRKSELKKEIMEGFQLKRTDADYTIDEKIEILWKDESGIFWKDGSKDLEKLGVHRKEAKDAIVYKHFVKAYKILVLVPVKKGNVESEEEKIGDWLNTICDEERIIEKLSLESEVESIKELEKNNGKKRIYYLCFEVENGAKNETTFNMISRLLNLREDGLSTMHIDDVIMLMDFSDASRKLSPDEQKAVIINTEWYIVEKLGMEWSKHFIFAVAVPINDSKVPREDIEELIKMYIYKNYSKDDIELFVATEPYDGLKKIVKTRLYRGRYKRSFLSAD